MQGTKVDRKNRKGFSLVEVLIVTAILTLLAGIIFAASGPARRAAQLTSCTSNLRQIGMAYSMYLSDYGQYPDVNVLMQKAAPLYLKDRRVLYCPSYAGGPLQNLTSSYDAHFYVPPDAARLATLHTVEPSAVLVWCAVHARDKELPLGGGGVGTRRVPSDYPFYLVLRADGHVGRVHKDRVREVPFAGPIGMMFTAAFPDESWYDRALTPNTPGVPAP